MVDNKNYSGVRQAELIMALSLATDLGTGRPMEWALCSALLSIRLGEALALGEQELREIYYVALLRYIGCTADVDTRVDLFGDDPGVGGSEYVFADLRQPHQVLGWMYNYVGKGQNPLQRLLTIARMPAAMPNHMLAHCEVAQLFTDQLGFEKTIQELVLQTYERWDGRGMPQGQKGGELTLPTRITQLAQDVESYRRAGREGEVAAVVRQRAGSAYDPHIAEVFCRDANRLMSGLEHEATWETVLAMEPGQRRYLTNEELDNAIRVLADFIDLISPYYTCHSRNVAALAAVAAQHYGLPSSDVKAVERMGWLHDLGKISVPLGVWGKTSSLTSSEWERVRLHPYYTERILARSNILSGLGACAAFHHERLDGSGYHRGVSASAISPAAGLLAVANFYCTRISHGLFVKHYPLKLPLTNYGGKFAQENSIVMLVKLSWPLLDIALHPCVMTELLV